MEQLTLTTPALLFSAISLIMLAYTNRFLAYAAVVRSLHDKYLKEKDQILIKQIENIRKRLYLTRSMQIFGITSLLLCVLTMFLIYIKQNIIAVWVFGIALLLLITSLSLLIREIQISVEALEYHISAIEKKKKHLLKALLLLPLLSMGMNTPLGENTHDPKRPNVIIVFTDDQGYQDVGCYGAPKIKTPHLDTMAKNGIKLTDFYAAQAVCSASRAGLLTGCYPNRVGVHQAYMPHSRRGLNPNEETIAEMLKDNGYNTAIFGKWHLGDHPKFMPRKQGFDTFFGIPYSGDMWPYHPQQGTVFNFGPLPLYENETVIDTLTDQSQLTTQITERSVAFIKKNKNTPFFLYVAHPQPHVPLFVSDKFKGKSERGLYGDVIMEIDWSVGQILKTLKEEGLTDNTLVIFTSDNGPWLSYGDHAGSAFPFREGKGTALEGGQREPCIIQFPTKIKPGRTLNTPMMAIDILPTIAEITHSKLPEKKIDGKSVWSIWRGKTRKSRHKAYYFYYGGNQLRGVRYKHWKMYFPHKYITLNGRPGGKNGFPVNYEIATMKTIELYDLDKDIGETTDVADQHPKVVAKIKKLAEKIRVELGDRLQKRKGTEVRPVGLVPKWH